MLKNSIFCFIVYGLFACNFIVRHENQINSLKPINLKGEPIQLTNILNPKQVNLLGNQLIITDWTQNHIFNVYDEKHKFEYGFGIKGDGPNEYSFDSFVSKIDEDNLGILNLGNFKFNYYNLKENSASPVSSINFPKNLGVINQAFEIGKDKYVLNTTSNLGPFVIFDAKKNESNYVKYPKFLKSNKIDVEDQFATTGFVSINKEEGKIYYFFQHLDLMVIYDFNGNEIYSTSVKEDKVTHAKNIQSRIYFVGSTFNNGNVYALFLGLSEKEANNKPEKINMALYKFDSNGKVKNIYVLNQPLIAFTIKENQMIGINPLDEDNPIYSFRL